MNNKTFTWFIFLLGSSVVGCNTWRTQRTIKNLSDILTVSDEAFILLTFLNNKEKWEYWWEKMVCIRLTEPKYNRNIPHYPLLSHIHLYMQKEKKITKLSPKQIKKDFPEYPRSKYSSRKEKNGNGPVTSETKVGTKNLFLNGWTKEGQLMFNELMVKIRDDRHNYGEAFDKRFMKFCKQMEEKAQSKKLRKKRKHQDCIQIYSDNTIPPMKMENMTEDDKEQIKATNEEMQNWECEALDANFI